MDPPVGELPIEDQERYWISTRKAQLQYMQMLMNHVKKQGMVIAVVNEGTLFMYDAEQKVRQYLLNDYQIQGVISLPAGAFLPYTGSKASVLIFTREEEIDKEQPVWFYEIQNLGYSLDRRQESTGVDDIPAMLTFRYHHRPPLDTQPAVESVRLLSALFWEVFPSTQTPSLFT